MSSITEMVRDQYAAVARSGLSNDSEAVKSVAAAFGYSADELALLPSEVNMGLSCGNPVATRPDCSFTCAAYEQISRSAEVITQNNRHGGLTPSRSPSKEPNHAIPKTNHA